MRRIFLSISLLLAAVVLVGCEEKQTETEDEALEFAEHEAEVLDADDFDFNSVTGTCVTDVEDI